MNHVNDLQKTLTERYSDKKEYEEELSGVMVEVKSIEREIEMSLESAMDEDVDMSQWPFRMIRMYLQVSSIEDIFLLPRTKVLQKLEKLYRSNLINNPEFRKLWLYGDDDWKLAHGDEPSIDTGKSGARIEDLHNRLADYLDLH